MAIFRFGQGKGGIDYPPKKDEEALRPSEEAESSTPATGEPIFRSHPDTPLSIDSLVEKAHSGEPLAMVEELDEYYDGWMHYAHDRNLFNGSASIKALAQARREAIRLAKEGDYDGLRAKLEELSGPVAAGVETAAEENLQRIQNPDEFTHAERRQELKSNVESIEATTLHESVSARSDKSEILLSRNEDKRYLEREAKASEFAEKYDISAERAALLEAEEEYAAAIRDRNEKYFSFKFRDQAETREQREKMENALSAWRSALASAGDRAEVEGSAQDRISARFISARDTMTRMERIRQDATVEGLDARSKTWLGKVDAYANALNGKMASGAQWLGGKYVAASEKVGSVIAGKIIEKVVDKEADFEKYQRASRIVGSAVIMTAILAPFGAVAAGAAGMNFIWRTGRGFFGWGAGTGAGISAGKVYDTLYGSKEERSAVHEVSQKDLLSVLKGKDGTFERVEQKWLEDVYKNASEREFTKSEKKHEGRRARAQIGATALVAGVSAYGLSNLPHVQDALATMDSHTVGVGQAIDHPSSVDSHITGAHPHPHPHVPGPHSPAVEAANNATHIDSVSVGGNVNDADKLFGRFMDNIRHQFPDPAHAPPALRSLLEHYHGENGVNPQDALTRFLHLQNGGSVVVHPGDTLSFEHGKVLFQGHELIDEHGNVHNLRVGNAIHIQHPHEAHAAHVEKHEASEELGKSEMQQAHTPSSPTQNATPASAVPADDVSHEPTPIHEAASTAHEQQPVHTPTPSNDNEILLHDEPTASLEPQEMPPASAPEAASAPIDHLITNHFGIGIDEQTPHIYALEGSKGQAYVLYGGDAEARREFLDSYLENPDFSNHPLLTPAIDPNDPSGKQVLVAFSMNVDQNMLVPTTASDSHGHILHFGGVDTFESLIY